MSEETTPIVYDEDTSKQLHDTIVASLLELPSYDPNKRKRTEEGDGPEIIPWDLYAYIHEALAYRNYLKTNQNDSRTKQALECRESIIRATVKDYKKTKDLPRRWKYDPDSTTNLVAIHPHLDPKCPPPSDHLHRKVRCCTWVHDPKRKLPKTLDVPLNEDEKKIWMMFKESNKADPGLDEVVLAGCKKQFKPIADIKDPFISLTGEFAVAAFNECIEKYLKTGVHNNLYDFQIMEGEYIKVKEGCYYFNIIIEAFEERKNGVYETKVRVAWADGRRSLNKLVLTDREPSGKREMKTPYRKTHPGSWLEPPFFYSGLLPRKKGSSCRGYDYFTPWGVNCP